MTMSYIVVVGNVFDGLTFYGPFDNAAEAGDWAADESETAHGVIGNDTWVVAEMALPSDDDGDEE